MSLLPSVSGLRRLGGTGFVRGVLRYEPGTPQDRYYGVERL